MSVLTLEAKLERTGGSTPWGFRLGGGKDFSSPLTIQKVDPGSLASKCGLQVGDIIQRIGAVTTEPLKHKEAKECIMGCGNKLDLLLQRGGNGGYETFNGQINTNWNAPAPAPAMAPVAPPVNPLKQNFNPTPRPFGSAAPAPTINGINGVNGINGMNGVNGIDNIAQQTENMSISNSIPKPVAPPAFVPSRVEAPAYQSVADKYSERDDAVDPSLPQSKSFKYLQGLMDEGKELNNALKPRNTPATLPMTTDLTPAALPPAAPAPLAAPIGPGRKPGTVKAIVSQRYNNPLGLYSNENQTVQLEGQAKFLVDDETAGGAADPLPPRPPPPSTGADTVGVDGKKKWVPSETFKLVQEEKGLIKDTPEDKAPAHSRTFRMLQSQLGNKASPASPVPAGPPAAPPAPAFKPAPAANSAFASASAVPAAKPWIPSPAPSAAPAPPAPPAPAVINSAPAPFAGIPGGLAMPKPTGVGATRGLAGDAAMNAAPGAAGRIPVCSGCNGPIRGPFVTALGKCWCPQCFVCANPQCCRKLLDVGFVEEGGYLYCEQCYAQHFAPNCEKCGQPIIGECVNALGKSFHPECFLCAHCNCPIGGTKFHIEDGKFYCEKHWAALFQTMCAGCEFPIEPGDRWVEAMGKNYHSECFNCAACGVNLEGQQFCAKNGKPYCKKHAR